MNSLTISKDITLAHIPDTILFFKQQILNGVVDPLEADHFLKCLEELVKVRKDKEVQAVVLEEAEKYAGQSFKGSFPKVVERRTAIINDTKLNELKAQVKAREKMLKSLSEPVVDPETGEELLPPEFKVTRSIRWEK